MSRPLTLLFRSLARAGKHALATMFVFVGALVVQAQTSITSISPTTGPVGTVVTITGINFGASQGLTSTVTFSGVVAAGRGRPATSWSNSSITLVVPNGATAGGVVVIVGGNPSNGVIFAVKPIIQGLSPTSGLAGSTVIVTGTGFGNTQAQGPSTVAFNNVVATPSTWGSTSFAILVPSGAFAGNVVVTVGGQVSNGMLFTPTPVISNLSPPSGVSGTTVTIAGSSFGDSQGTSVLTFNGVAAANISAWSNTNITARVPNNTTTGDVAVAVNGVASNRLTFTLTPAISGVTPNPALANLLVTIAGNNFGTSQGAGTVTFNGVAASATSWSNTSITVPVPGSAANGDVVVTVNGVSSNPMPFSLVAPYSFGVTYAPNGDVLAANDSINGTWTYGYDDFNRLATANNAQPLQGFSYLYDEYGNRWQQNVTAGTGSASILTFNGNATATTVGNCYHVAGLNNQIDGFCYDAAGNLLNDGQHNYVYDAENRIVSVDGGAVTYLYDGEGQRIRKTAGAATVNFLLGPKGQVVTELNALGGWTRSEVYAAERHLATYSNGITYFEQSDWLGSQRVRTLSSGEPFEICSNLPFGDGLSCTGSTDPSPNHFTGKERDQESGLDNFGARYYASNLGRFMSPDPMMIMRQKMFDPQQWNMYSYTRNNPLRFIDPNGKWPTETHGRIIDRAFPGLSDSQRQVLKGASAYVDRIPGGQTRAHNHEHAMKSPGEDPAAAIRAIDGSISANEGNVRRNGGPLPGRVGQLNQVQLYNFGEALHTVTDRTSPAHTDANGNPRDWNGLPTSMADKDKIDEHVREEANISPEQMNAAVDAARQAFGDTFGPELERQAQEDPKSSSTDSQGQQHPKKDQK